MQNVNLVTGSKEFRFTKRQQKKWKKTKEWLLTKLISREDRKDMFG